MLNSIWGVRNAPGIQNHSGDVEADGRLGNAVFYVQVVRMEIKAAAPAAAAAEAEGPTSANADATADVALPSLVVGREETGEAFCTGLSSSVDCQAALLSVAAGGRARTADNHLASRCVGKSVDGHA